MATHVNNTTPLQVGSKVMVQFKSMHKVVDEKLGSIGTVRKVRCNKHGELGYMVVFNDGDFWWYLRNTLKRL